MIRFIYESYRVEIMQFDTRSELISLRFSWGKIEGPDWVYHDLQVIDTLCHDENPIKLHLVLVMPSYASMRHPMY